MRVALVLDSSAITALLGDDMTAMFMAELVDEAVAEPALLGLPILSSITAGLGAADVQRIAWLQLMERSTVTRISMNAGIEDDLTDLADRLGDIELAHAVYVADAYAAQLVTNRAAWVREKVGPLYGIVSF